MTTRAQGMEDVGPRRALLDHLLNEEPDPMVRENAAWALDRLMQRADS